MWCYCVWPGFGVSISWPAWPVRSWAWPGGLFQNGDPGDWNNPTYARHVVGTYMNQSYLQLPLSHYIYIVQLALLQGSLAKFSWLFFYRRMKIGFLLTSGFTEQWPSQIWSHSVATLWKKWRCSQWQYIYVLKVLSCRIDMTIFDLRCIEKQPIMQDAKCLYWFHWISIVDHLWTNHSSSISSTRFHSTSS